MTTHVNIKRTTPDDVIALARDARREDKREVEGLTGRPLLYNLVHALKHAQPCLTARSLNGELLAMFGVIAQPPPEQAPKEARKMRHGLIAMIGTKALEKNRIAVLRGSRDYLKTLERRYDFLHNVCDARNKLHLDYLRWLGFTIDEEVHKAGAAQIPVHYFYKMCKHV